MENAINVNAAPEVPVEVVEPDVVAAVEAEEAAAESPAVSYGGGKFQSVEDLEKGYANLQSKLGSQGGELSAIRKQLEALSANTQQPGQPAEQVDNYQAQMEAINEQVESGDLSYTQGMTKIAEIATARATENAIKGVQSFQEQQTVESSKQAFLQNNPDFVEVQESGLLEAIKNQLPGLHDDFSAFQAYRANQIATDSKARIEAARLEGIALGKAEMAKIANGDQETSKVLAAPGSQDIVLKPGKPKTAQELRESGLAAFRAASAS